MFRVGVFIRNHTVRHASVIDIRCRTELSVASQVAWILYRLERKWAYAIRRMEAVINEAVIQFAFQPHGFQDNHFLLGLCLWYACCPSLMM